MSLIPTLPFNLEIIVIVMAVAYTCISILAQRKLSNPRRMREIQTQVKNMQKEMTAMMKNNATQDQLTAKQKEFMPLMGEQMKYSMKPMLVIFPLLLITYYVIMPILPFGSLVSAQGGAPSAAARSSSALCLCRPASSLPALPCFRA